MHVAVFDAMVVIVIGGHSDHEILEQRGLLEGPDVRKRVLQLGGR
jgi:hypothetical protein